MWLAGWVHRDISAGNILWFKEDGNDGRGILSDLEYARKMGVGSASSDPKTVSYNIYLKVSLSHKFPQGTPFFMALEIMDGFSLYHEFPAVKTYNANNFDSEAFEYHESQSTLASVHQVTYNYLHDAESLCWVYLWILLSRVPHPSSQTLANDVFQNAGDASTGRRNLWLGGVLEEQSELFHPTVRRFLTLWNISRQKLFEAFCSTRLEDRTDGTYAVIYTQLYVLCRWGSETVDVPRLSSVRRLDPLTMPPLTPQSRLEGHADDEDYITESESSLGMENTQLGKRSMESKVCVVIPRMPMKKRRTRWLAS